MLLNDIVGFPAAGMNDSSAAYMRIFLFFSFEMIQLVAEQRILPAITTHFSITCVALTPILGRIVDHHWRGRCRWL
jgi:hypothetical protein